MNAKDDDKTPPPQPAPPPQHQPKNPLHGVTLEMMLRALVAQYGWEGLAKQIQARCFAVDPSMGSSLKFLRKTPWARGKVEGLYLFLRREQARRGPGGQPRLSPSKGRSWSPEPAAPKKP